MYDLNTSLRENQHPIFFTHHLQSNQSVSERGRNRRTCFFHSVKLWYIPIGYIVCYLLQWWSLLMEPLISRSACKMATKNQRYPVQATSSISPWTSNGTWWVSFTSCLCRYCKCKWNYCHYELYLSDDSDNNGLLQTYRQRGFLQFCLPDVFPHRGISRHEI